MNRREFSSLLPVVAVGSAGLVVPKESDAVWPLLLRLFLGGVIRGSITRTTTVAIARGVTARMVTTASLGLRTSGILAVSASVAHAYEKHRASEIWVTGKAEQAVTVSTEKGASAKREQVFIGYRIVDIESGKVDKVGLKNVSIEPDKKLFLSHLITDLPYSGAKFVEGLATFDSKGQRVNDNFHFPERKIVIVANSDDVRS